MVNLNFILARSRSMTEVCLWCNWLLCPSFLLAESTPFHNSQECHMPCFASPLASILLNSFRVQTFWCKVRKSIYLLLCHAKFMVKYWNYRPYHVSISYHETVKPVESEYGAVSFTMTRNKNIRPFPAFVFLDEAVTLTFSCCEVSASRMLQVPESYSLNFFKNFFCCRFSENFSCLTVK